MVQSVLAARQVVIALEDVEKILEAAVAVILIQMKQSNKNGNRQEFAPNCAGFCLFLYDGIVLGFFVYKKF